VAELVKAAITPKSTASEGIPGAILKLKKKFNASKVKNYSRTWLFPLQFFF